MNEKEYDAVVVGSTMWQVGHNGVSRVVQTQEVEGDSILTWIDVYVGDTVARRISLRSVSQLIVALDSQQKSRATVQ